MATQHPSSSEGTVAQVLQAVEVSVNIRAAGVYRSFLGLFQGSNLPIPMSSMRLIQSRPGFLEASADGTLRHRLGPLVDQRLFESLRQSSKVSYVSGVHSWIHFTGVTSISPAAQLDIT